MEQNKIKFMSSESVRQAIERFALLAKGARGAACRAVITQAVQAPDTFAFGELTEVPSVREVCQSDPQAALLLQLFSYGTLADYKANQANLPELTPVLLKKLRLLTLVTFAGRSKTVGYQDLLRELDLSSVRELEDLIIDAIYIGLVGGKLDQKNQCLEVNYSSGRDLKVGELAEMTQTISAWAANSHALLQGLQERMNDANTRLASFHAKEEATLALIEETKKNVAQQTATSLASHVAPEHFDDSNRIRSKRFMRSRDPGPRDVTQQVGRAM